MMKITQNNSMYTETTKRYFEKDFISLVEDHSSYLRGLATTTTITVEPISTYRYRSDFFGYLRSKGITPKLWIPILIINRMRDPQNFNDSWKNAVLLVPSEQEIDKLITSYKRK
ncbi:hypothetical protein CZP2022_188 [Vibrio phage C-ZP2022]|nr:hypothetical protein CZP2022_188 [Vibrio phage C-ZP2022]